MARRFVWTYNPLMGAKTLFTVEQFLQSPEYLSQDSEDGRPCRYELDEGEIIEMPSATIRHNYMGREILMALAIFLRNTKLGEVLYETDVQLDSNTIYSPDVMYWDAQRFATIDQSKVPVLIIPQFVVEIASPSNSFKGLLRRAAKFQRAGVHTVWIVNDDPLEIHVFEPSGRRIVTAGKSLTLPKLLPGFSMEASQLLPPA